jgi:hypothetical protein
MAPGDILMLCSHPGGVRGVLVSLSWCAADVLNVGPRCRYGAFQEISGNRYGGAGRARVVVARRTNGEGRLKFNNAMLTDSAMTFRFRIEADWRGAVDGDR